MYLKKKPYYSIVHNNSAMDIKQSLKFVSQVILVPIHPSEIYKRLCNTITLHYIHGINISSPTDPWDVISILKPYCLFMTGHQQL